MKSISDLKLLYYGQAAWGSTSLQRFNILRDVFKSIYLVDSRRAFPDKKSGRTFSKSIQARIGMGSLISLSSKILLQEVDRFMPNVVWIDGGFLINSEVLRKIKKKGIKVIHYTPDSIHAPGLSNFCFKESVKEYDFIVTTKRQDINTYKTLKALNIITTQQGFDPSIHSKLEIDLEDTEFSSEVVFIGHRMKDRSNFLEHLIKELDVDLKIFGTAWDSFFVPRQIRNCFYGPAIGVDYARAINGAKICLGFLNHEVFDEITTRSFEIPSSGGFLLAERTEQHLEILEEGVDAAFFSSKKELVEKVDYYLSNEEQRLAIRDQGHKKITQGRYSWKILIEDALDQMNL